VKAAEPAFGADAEERRGSTARDRAPNSIVSSASEDGS
jgi:hypothetical protein